MKRITSLFFLMFCCSEFASALELQGAGIYRRLNVDVFVASIHTDERDKTVWLQSRSALTLEMRVVADKISPRRFRRIWNEGLAINLPVNVMNDYAVEVGRFTRLLEHDLVVGDLVSISNQTGKTVVSVDGTELLALDRPEFVRVLLQAWIGKFPHTPVFKEELLGMPMDKRDSVREELALITYTEERGEEVQSWLEDDSSEDTVELVASVASGLTAATELSAPINEPSAAASVIANGSNKEEALVEAENVEETAEPEIASESNESTKKAVAPSVKEQLLAQQEAEKAAKQLAAEQERIRQEEEAQLIAWQKAENAYYRQMMMKANKEVVYPKSAIRREQEGSVRIHVVVNRLGEVILAETSVPSNFAALNKAAIKAAKSAAPYSPIPEALSGEEFEFDLPFRFYLASE